MFQTCIQILLNLYGPNKKEIAFCYSKLAQVNYRLAKIDQAILFQKLAAKTFKKIFGDDHYQTTHAYLHPGLFYFGAQLYKKAEKYLMKSLYFKFLIGGEAVNIFHIFQFRFKAFSNYSSTPIFKWS